MVNGIESAASEFFPDKTHDDYIKQTLKYLIDKMGIDMNIDAVISSSKRIKKLIDNGKLKVTIH